MRQLLLAILVLVGGPTAYTEAPPDVQHSVNTVLLLMGLLGPMLAGVRPLLNLIPAHWALRRYVELIDKVLGWLAGNSKPLAARFAPLKRPSGPPFGFVLCLAALVLMGCAGTQRHPDTSIEGRTRNMLEATRVAVDAGYSIAMESCTARERAVLAKAKAQGFKQAYADEFENISEACHKTREAFDAIRALHTEAVHLVEDGAIEEAQAAVQRLLNAWRELRGGGHGEAG